MLLAGCTHYLPSDGPSSRELDEGLQSPAASSVQVVEVTEGVARKLFHSPRTPLFSEALGTEAAAAPTLGVGDSLEINIWEAPPATLFGAGVTDARAVSGSRGMVLPEQVIDSDGTVTVPFAGRVQVLGLTPQAVASEIAQRLKGKANQPEVLVRRLRSASSMVTVVGEVNSSIRMPLTASGERLLDALAAAGGVRQPVTKTTVQLTRGDSFHSLPLDLVIRDPRQNIPLRAGDVVTALFQPLSFIALGATGKNEEINFEGQGISLAQALARAGGLVDSRSNPEGVFVFRLERADALDWPRQPVATTPDGRVPVVYRIDLRNPASFFVMQSFPMSHRDVLFVSNAPSTDLQKFLNLVFSVAYPVLTTIQVTR